MVSNTIKQVIIFAICIIIPNIPSIYYGLSPSFQERVRNRTEELVQPSGTPPSWVFGPVWLFLYISMGAAHYIVYRTGGGWFTKDTTVPTVFYIIQLILNWIWTPLYFILNNLLLSSIDIVALLLAVLITAFLFFKVNTWSGLLFIPYIIWVSYASQLCIRTYLLNPNA